jgi:hypothetical protein
VGSMALDEAADRLAEEHVIGSWRKDGIRFGDALSVAAHGLSGLFALDDLRPNLSDAGVAALEAGALVAADGLKYAFGRARPTAGLGASEFEPGSSGTRFHSFPSRRATTLMWAAVTPYAKEYGASRARRKPRALALRHRGRRGARLRAGLAHLEARRESRRAKDAPTVVAAPGEVMLKWDLDSNDQWYSYTSKPPSPRDEGAAGLEAKSGRAVKSADTRGNGRGAGPRRETAHPRGSCTPTSPCFFWISGMTMEGRPAACVPQRGGLAARGREDNHAR